MKRFFYLLTAVLLCQLASLPANGSSISGAIQFFGGASSSGPSGPPTTIHFTNPWHSLAGTGVYSSVPFGTPTQFMDFTFVGDGTLAVLTSPDLPLWTFSLGSSSYSFDLLQLTNGHAEPGSMSFSGNGVVHASGYDDTPASFGLQGSGNSFEFALSSSTTASVVPEPGPTALFSCGLVVTLLWLGRRLVSRRAC